MMMAGCTGRSETRDETLPADIDIKQTAERVMTLAAEEPERALAAIDSFRTAGRLTMSRVAEG